MEISMMAAVFFGNMALAAVILLFVVVHSHRNKKWFIRQEQFLMHRELMKARLDIHEQTLKTISNDLHDNVGQKLTLAKLHATTIDTGDLHKTVEKLQQIKMLLSESINDVRYLSRSLNAEHIASVGLVYAIERELEVIRTIGTIETKCLIDDNITGLSGDQEVIIYRVMQEALHNIIKHAQATMIKVIMRSVDYDLLVEIADNGKGFEPEKVWQVSNGLRNMRNRCMLLGGTFAIITAEGDGCLIRLTIPIEGPTAKELRQLALVLAKQKIEQTENNNAKIMA